MRVTPALRNLFHEMHGGPASAPHTPTVDELRGCLEPIQTMENAFLSVRLDEHWAHPDNKGWVALFTMWARSPTFRAVWHRYQDVFGIRFGYFCQQRLGL